MVVPADSPAGRGRLVSVLRRGGLAVIPCDTIYGIVGAVPETEARIRAVKGRPGDKPFLQLIAEASWARRLCGTDAPPRLARYWPGPLTIVLPVTLGRGAPRRGSRRRGPAARPVSVALRVPGSEWLRHVIARVGRPVYSTSVNRSGGEPLWRIADIVQEFERDVDLVLDGGDLPNAAPSTIVDAAVHPYRLLRAGALPLELEDLA